jgi:hypothetical protein
LHTISNKQTENRKDNLYWYTASLNERLKKPNSIGARHN